MLTIGYGHTRNVTIGQTITEAQAETLLADDLTDAGASVLRLVTVALTDNQYAALCSFTFNVGSGALGSSTLLRKLNQGDYASVPGEMNRWTKATVNGIKQSLPGLVRRRAAEGALFDDDGSGMPQAVDSPEA